MAKQIDLRMTADELAWVRHAAGLVHLTPREYIRRAINDRLRREGVDALLLQQSDWD